MQQPAGDVQPLPHAARVRLDALALPPLEPHELEQLVDPGALAATVDRDTGRRSTEVVERRQAVVQPAVAAEDVPDAPPHLPGVLARRRSPSTRAVPTSGAAAW